MMNDTNGSVPVPVYTGPMSRYKDDIVRHTCELIRIRSVKEPELPGKPFGEGNWRALDYMLKLAESMGFAVSHTDGYAGHAEYGAGEEIAAVLVHLDTVHEGDGWNYDPFGGTVADGRIYGRGAADDKGPAVVALYALKALKDSGYVPRKRVRVIFGTNEESGMKDLDYYFAKEPLPSLAFAPDAGYPIYNVELGNMLVAFRWMRTEVDLAAGSRVAVLSFSGGIPIALIPKESGIVLGAEDEEGRKELGRIREAVSGMANIMAAWDGEGGDRLRIQSGSQPVQEAETGTANAVVNLMAAMRTANCRTNMDGLLRFLQERIGLESNGASLGISCEDDVSGKLVVYVKQVTTEEDRVVTVVSIRYPVTHSGERVIETVTELAGSYGLETDVIRHLHPVYVNPDHEVIRRLSRAYERVTGEKAELLRMGAGTYARKLRNNGVAFGAGLRGGVNNNIHAADEFVVIEDLMRHADICYQGLYEIAQE
ncbi:Sapep family Mn(2+)-dependent dipeptidase [Paenibacillus sp. GCM10012303]|uniref:Sapep family Mn(2+)-dependent dipeptidase n=1 Tax=Paenibacillus sp. GCM10012303 TaxID=3317340 RepID=UPI003622C187